MSFQSFAQELIVLEPMEESTMPVGHSHPHGHSHPRPHHHEAEEAHAELNGNPVHVDVEITVEELPGAGKLSDVPMIVEEEEVSEEEKSSKESDKDQNDARKSKKSEKWDWESKGASGFITWVKERLETVPRHSGMDTAGLERAISYLDKLDSEISKAMRLDLEGELDANKIEEVRSKIDDGLSRLQERLDKVKSSKRKKKAEFEVSDSPFLVKEAQKITGVKGVYVTVPLLISRVARVCINGMVSAGHDIEDLYARQVKAYKLNNREQAEVMQLLSDMGYPLRQDRGFMPEEALEVSDSNGMDWASNYIG